MDTTPFLVETTSAVISVIVAGVATLIGLYFRKRFKFLRDVHRSLKDEPGANTSTAELVLADTERLMREQAATILKVVRPYQRHEPITIERLYQRLVDAKDVKMPFDHFQQALSTLLRQNRLPGLVREKDCLFIHEEHISWKKEVATTEKHRIAEAAYAMINSGDVVALDAGTTTLEIAKLIAAGFRDKALKKITVVTNSFLVADALVSTSNELGLEDHDPMFRLFIVGGRVRLNTMAIVDDNTSVDEDIFHDYDRVLPALGGADIGFVGTNGVLKGVGFTTADPGERRAKASLLVNSRRKVVVTMDERFGLRQAEVFATFDEGVTIITNEGAAKATIRDYQDYLNSKNTDIIIV